MRHAGADGTRHAQLPAARVTSSRVSREWWFQRCCVRQAAPPPRPPGRARTRGTAAPPPLPAGTRTADAGSPAATRKRGSLASGWPCSGRVPKAGAQPSWPARVASATRAAPAAGLRLRSTGTRQAWARHCVCCAGGLAAQHGVPCWPACLHHVPALVARGEVAVRVWAAVPPVADALAGALGAAGLGLRGRKHADRMGATPQRARQAEPSAVELQLLKAAPRAALWGRCPWPPPAWLCRVWGRSRRCSAA